MKVTCISAANIEPAKRHSASVRTCEMIRDLLLVVEITHDRPRHVSAAAGRPV